VSATSYIGTLMSLSGNITGGNVLSGGQISTSGNISGGNIIGTIVGTIATTSASLTGNLTANNVLATTIVNAASHTGSLVSVTGNVTAATNISAIGNVIGSYILGNGASLTGLTVTSSANSIANGTSSISIPVANGAGIVTTGGVSNIAVFLSTGVSITGTVTATGNVNTGSGVSAVGNVTAAGITTTGSGGTISGTGAVIGGTISSTGNVIATNIYANVISNAASFTGTQMSLTGNITGANILTTLLSVTGAITSTNSTAIQAIANNAGIELGNTSAINTPYVDFHSSGNTIADYDSRIIAGGGSSGNSTSGTGNLSLVGYNIQATGNILTSLAISATGNITGGNVSATSLTGSVISVSGNVTGGNLTTAGVLTVNSGAAATAIVNGAGNAVGNIGSAGTYFKQLFAQATTALYADLAEMYVSDAVYEPGTVVVFGGNQEVTISTTDSSRRVAGVISTNPAHVMNSGLQGEFTVAVALSGRVPTLVSGPVAKGDMMVSAGHGRARAEENPVLGSIIGKALEDFNGTEGTIEIVVGRL
jgi:hypothetical protein